jgi:hypothetical protein
LFVVFMGQELVTFQPFIIQWNKLNHKGSHARYRKHKWYTQSWIQIFFYENQFKYCLFLLFWKELLLLLLSLTLFFFIYKKPIDLSLIKLGMFFYKKIWQTYLTIHESWIKSKIIIWFFLWLFGWYKMKNMNFLINQDGF